MSIIRFSAINHTLYAPSPEGDIDKRDYNKRRKTGALFTAQDWNGGDNDHMHLKQNREALAHFMQTSLQNAMSSYRKKQPVLFMVHGFLYNPTERISGKPEDTDNPHGRNFHFVDGDPSSEIRHHTTSWPLHLGFEENDAGKHGMAIAYGWHSSPGLASSLLKHGQNHYQRAYRYAEESATPLHHVISAVDQLLEADIPIDIMCHSLGSRVVIRLLAKIAQHTPHLLKRIGKVIILGGAEYVFEAEVMLKSIYASGIPMPEIYNFITRENDVLDTLAENFGPKGFGNHSVIGHDGIDKRGIQPVDQWLDIQLDSKEVHIWADKEGFKLRGDNPGFFYVMDHWYYYTFRGNMAFYHKILRERKKYSVTSLKQRNIPAGVLISH